MLINISKLSCCRWSAIQLFDTTEPYKVKQNPSVSSVWFGERRWEEKIFQVWQKWQVNTCQKSKANRVISYTCGKCKKSLPTHLTYQGEYTASWNLVKPTVLWQMCKISSVWGRLIIYKRTYSGLKFYHCDHWSKPLS